MLFLLNILPGLCTDGQAGRAVYVCQEAVFGHEADTDFDRHLAGEGRGWGRQRQERGNCRRCHRRRRCRFRGPPPEPDPRGRLPDHPVEGPKGGGGEEDPAGEAGARDAGAGSLKGRSGGRSCRRGRTGVKNIPKYSTKKINPSFVGNRLSSRWTSRTTSPR